MAVDVSSDRSNAEAIAQLARVLSDPVRVQIVQILRARSHQVCQCELNPVFDISQPTLSHHVKKLSDAGIVEVERRGRWAYYSLNPEALEVLTKWLS
jgi:ArsR family transcriptional regulator